MRRFILGAFFVLCTPLIVAQDVPEGELSDAVPFHLPRTRWSEDWSVLKDSELDYDSFWRPIKFIRLDAAGENYLSIGGETRLTYEQYDPADRGLTAIGTEDVGLLRLSAYADWHLGTRWRIFAQLGAALAGDRDGGNKVVDESHLNVWQLFVDHELPLGDERTLIFRLGRQIVETANTFITAGEANNLRLYHQGLRVAVKTPEFVPVDVFFTESVDYANGAFEMSGNGEYLWGGRAGRLLDASGIKLNFLYLGWDLFDRNFEQGAPEKYDETRHTLMLWVNRPLAVGKRLGLDYYIAYQFGTYDDRPGGSDIGAFGAYGGFEYALFPRVRTPILGLKTSYFSGDDDPTDNELNTFYDPVFGSPYFSWARDVMPYNLIHVQPNIGYRFTKELRITLGHDVLWRESAGDGFYTDVNTLGVRAGASDALFIGSQTQLAVAWKPTRHITALAHLVRFWAGDYIEEAGGTDQTYFHVGLTYLF
jgi:hypothetical protein